MQKADRALLSARLLLDAGDMDGACNRAYYAMFDAARAALANAVEPETTKTHRGLIAAFGLQLVKPGRLPKELGRLLNRAEDVRLLADYTGDSVEPGDARELLVQAATFVKAVQDFLDGSRDALGAPAIDP
ncbi:MAG: HEPN domain-containing protein [Lamprobacter sp.]|uniref:HEPN domain-containing protein n=1 Tax=Lamprobacter sp. TaxID=3100796 RepID=UPI002B25F14A|nr:HEPN domain-containing protein [Lamprobacter sp.]MEA3644056.1 HEPN domain-containing protein [Lamprobacter sp.]